MDKEGEEEEEEEGEEFLVVVNPFQSRQARHGHVTHSTRRHWCPEARAALYTAIALTCPTAGVTSATEEEGEEGEGGTVCVQLGLCVAG